jgi:DNA-directed RNA polymerase subunit RPC12/RpoP
MEGWNKMTYQCIKCKKTWVNGGKSELYSHGLCKDCARILLIPTIRRKQLREGNFDCFGKALSYCDQNLCKYKLVCLNNS